MNDNLTISIIREHMRKIGQKGGKRRAQTTTAAQRKRIARTRDPSADTLARCERCERYVVPRTEGADNLCPYCALVL